MTTNNSKTSKTSKAKKLSVAVANALRTVFKAEDAAEAARGSAQETAKAEAAKIFASLKPKPGNGKALDAQIARIKAAAVADGLKEECNSNTWKNTWAHVSAYMYIMLRPKAATETEKRGKKVTLSAQSVGTNARDVQTLAAHIRAQEGTGKPRAKRAPSHNDTSNKPAPTPADVQRLAEKNFKVNADSVRALVEKIFKAQSGIGLLADCLKAHGWGLAKLSEK